MSPCLPAPRGRGSHAESTGAGGHGAGRGFGSTPLDHGQSHMEQMLKDHLSRKMHENGDCQWMKLLIINGLNGDIMVVDGYHKPTMIGDWFNPTHKSADDLGMVTLALVLLHFFINLNDDL